MKHLLLVSCLGAPLLLASGCGGAPNDPAALAAATHTAEFTVEGMTCASCSVTVRMAANKLDGVALVDVDVPAGRATIRYDGAKVTAQQIAEAVSEAGYATAVLSEQGS